MSPPLLCVSGFGVIDPSEQAETRKARDQASTLVFPSFKDLANNQGALALLKDSNFVKDFMVYLDTRRGQETQQGPDKDRDYQHLVFVSYPENKGKHLEKIKVRKKH